MILFSTAEEVIFVPGRGYAIVFSTVYCRLRVRDPIQLRTPEGHITDTYVAGFGALSGPAVKGRMGLILPPEISKESISKGTEIWMIPKT